MSGQGINIGSLSVEQLQSLKKQLEQESHALGQNYTALRMAENRFNQSMIALNSLKEKNDGKGMKAACGAPEVGSA